MIPSAEKVVRAHLAADATVTAIAPAPRIGPRTPTSTEEPWVRITLFDDPPTDDGVDHHIAAYMQIDCFAGTNGDQGDADDLSRAVRAALATMPSASHDGAVVSGIRRPTRARIPDVDFEPAMERYTVTVTVYLHAI